MRTCQLRGYAADTGKNTDKNSSYCTCIPVFRYSDVSGPKDRYAGAVRAVLVCIFADSFLRGKRVLIVDDIWDRGKQVVNVTERVRQAGGEPQSTVLHYKPHRSDFPDKSPDFHATETEDWIIYPWEVERGIVGT